MRDSNPRMSAPKADALPLGESPMYDSWKELSYFTIFGSNCGGTPSFTSLLMLATIAIYEEAHCYY